MEMESMSKRSNEQDQEEELERSSRLEFLSQFVPLVLNDGPSAVDFTHSQERQLDSKDEKVDVEFCPKSTAPKIKCKGEGVIIRKSSLKKRSQSVPASLHSSISISSSSSSNGFDPSPSGSYSNFHSDASTVIGVDDVDKIEEEKVEMNHRPHVHFDIHPEQVLYAPTSRPSSLPTSPHIRASELKDDSMRTTYYARYNNGGGTRSLENLREVGEREREDEEWHFSRGIAIKGRGRKEEKIQHTRHVWDVRNMFVALNEVVKGFGEADENVENVDVIEEEEGVSMR